MIKNDNALNHVKNQKDQHEIAFSRGSRHHVTTNDTRNKVYSFLAC